MKLEIYVKLQSQEKVAGTLGVKHAQPLPIGNFCIYELENKTLFFNIVSGGRGLLVQCPNIIVWDYRSYLHSISYLYFDQKVPITVPNLTSR